MIQSKYHENCKYYTTLGEVPENANRHEHVKGNCDSIGET